MNVKNTLSTIFFLLYFTGIVHAQKGVIRGVVRDAKTGETLIGANVVLESNPLIGSQTDLDGRFEITDLDLKTHTLLVSYISYQTKKVTDVEAKKSNLEDLTITLNLATKDIVAVVITATARKENINALLTIQKNSLTISDGIAQETLKKTGDRNTADALRRVSGISIQDNRFVVIRGLGDRYNYAMLNGMTLPSSEADRRSFSFDMIPSNLIDNIIINKAATPDMPAEFSGGIIRVNTKDIPDELVLNVAIGTGYNSLASLQPFNKQIESKTDWLGYDAGLRALSNNILPTNEYLKLNKKDRIAQSKLFADDWQYNQTEAPLNNSFQVSVGGSFKIKKMKWGHIAALTHNKNFRKYTINRNQFELDDVQLFKFSDQQSKQSILSGAMYNTSLQINAFHKITLRNMLNINSESSVLERGGEHFDNEQLFDATSQVYTSNRLASSQLSGDHYFEKSKIKVNWNASLNDIKRDVPNQRTLTYIINTNDAEDTIFTALVPLGSASPQFTGKFFSELTQLDQNIMLDVSRKFTYNKIILDTKVGGFYFNKDRNFTSRIFGPVFNMNSNGSFSYNIADLPSDKIFRPDNFKVGGLTYDEITLPQDQYQAQSITAGGYAMFDLLLFKKLKVISGVRYELFEQNLQTRMSVEDVVINKKFVSLLPSLNLTYLYNDKVNLRFAYSQTVSRPEFRELAPFGFYDFANATVIIGSESLVPGDIHNLDLRFERYQGDGQMLSFSLFYKYFNNPIEQVFFSLGAGSQTRSFNNADKALNYGAEVELRQRFSQHKERKILHNTSLSLNAAYIFSKVAFSTVAAATAVRPLQSQSPYLVNAMLDYTSANRSISTAVMFNLIGNRLIDVGNYSFPDIYEYKRPVLDLMFTKRIFKGCTIRLIASDVLAKDIIMFQDFDKNKLFSEVKDNVISRYNIGRTYTTTLAYNF